MELERERLRRERQREARRRKILATSEARMKKLQTMGKRSGVPDSLKGSDYNKCTPSCSSTRYLESEGDSVQRVAPAAEESLMQCEDVQHGKLNIMKKLGATHNYISVFFWQPQILLMS